GYEVVTAPDNFFYSHAFTMQYGEPFTHTGGLLSFAPMADLTVSAGLAKGWDNFEDHTDGNASFLGSVTYAVDESTSLILAVVSGNEGSGMNRTMYSAVGTHNFCETWSYVVQHDFGSQEAGSADGSNAQWWGVNQYLINKLNDTVSVGARAEGFRDDDGTRVAGLRSGSAAAAGDYFGFSLGLNYMPTAYLKVRPEVRWDLQDRSDSAAPSAYDNGTSGNQVTVSSDVILSF
ncbi:MAG: porin, partial [Deltaproteobacteria bacterium]|nr:porin [Deltaproteobacteria bacterium]